MNPDLVYGIHAVSRRLKQTPQSCTALICSDKRNQRLMRLVAEAREAGVAVRFEPRSSLTQMCGTEKHQGCVLECLDSGPRMDFGQCLESIHESWLLLVLDGVQDPHNLGACLRSADACGVDAVIIPRDRSVGLNATVRKVAAGGAESVPLIEVSNLARSLAQLKQAGAWIYGASDSAETSLYEHEFRGPVALVIGAEGSGLRRLTKEACDHLVKLPMLGQVESLNVSVATGVCLYEILRSRNYGQ